MSPVVKRKEEQLKFIFNWAFKFLKAKFLENFESAARAKDSDRLFYNYYFGKVAEERGISLAKFYKPTFNQTFNEFEKSFNTTFIYNIKLSDKFMEDFNAVLESEIYFSHARLIESKLQAIFSKWETLLLQNSFSEAAVKDVCEYIDKCRKFKFPWSFKEVAAAIGAVKKSMNYSPQ